MSEYSIKVCPYCGSSDYIGTDDFRWKCIACGEIFDDFDEVFIDEDNDTKDFESNEGMLDNLDDEQNLFNEFAYDDEEFNDDDYEAGIDNLNYDESDDTYDTEFDDFNNDGFDDGKW